MKEKKVNELIVKAMNADKPNRSILTKAKEEMSRETVTARVPWYKRKSFYGALSCIVIMAIIIPLLIFLPTENKGKKNGGDVDQPFSTELLYKTSVSSISKLTWREIYGIVDEPNGEILSESGTPSVGDTILHYSYAVESCKVYFYDEGRTSPAYIEEKYSLESGKIALAVIFSFNYNGEQRDILDYSEVQFTDAVSIKGTEVRYYIDETSARAAFERNGLTYYLKFSEREESKVFAHLEELLK